MDDLDWFFWSPAIVTTAPSIEESETHDEGISGALSEVKSTLVLQCLDISLLSSESLD